MNNLHISLDPCANASRILKETRSILDHNIATNVYIAATHVNELEEKHKYRENLILYRHKTKTKIIKGNVFVHAIRYLEYYYRVAKFYKNKDIGMVNLHRLELLPLGMYFKYIRGAIVVYDAHELETEQIATKSIKYSIIKRIFKIIERMFIKRVDIMFVVSESIADWYQKEYNIKRPIVVMNAPKYQQVAKTDKFRETLPIKKDSIIVLYQGGLMKNRGLELWIEAFKKRKDDKVVMIFMGYGELKEMIENAAKENNNIFYHPAVDPDILLTYTAAAAAAAVSYIHNSCLNYLYCMPNKFFEYTMVGLPVIASSLKDMSDTIKKYKLGIVVEQDTPDALNNAVDKLLSMDLEKIRQNTLKFAKEYAWENQEKKMIDEYKRVLKIQ